MGYLIGHLYLSGMWLGEVQGQMPKRHVFESDCSEYYNCSRLNNQHNAGTFTLGGMRILTLIIPLMT
jgi:hypothetical protein